jgi:hypothetical protein
MVTLFGSPPIRGSTVVACAWIGHAERWRHVWIRQAGWLLAAVLVVVGVMLGGSASARAANCALADFAYNNTCGPEFESPAWGDAAGWTDPSKYSTIKLADITGNGTDELIARNDDGLEIWTFDTTVGQWRPAIGADGLPEVLRDVHSPTPTEDVRGSWRDAAAFSTIQTADLYGDGAQEIIADHEPSGTGVWRYTPPAGSKSINGGTWSLVSTSPNLLPTSPAPSQYLSFHAVDAGGSPAVLTSQDAYSTFGDNSFHFAAKSTLAPPSSDASYYLDNMSALMPESHSSSRAPHLLPANVYRTPNGIAAQTFDGANWVQLGPPPTAGPRCKEEITCSPFSDSVTGFGSNPAYYETMRVANNLAGPRDPWGYVLGRLSDGLHIAALVPILSAPYGEKWVGDEVFPVLTALADPSPGTTPPPDEWSSIRTGDVSGDGKTDVLAVVNGQLRAWELGVNASLQVVWNELPAASTVNLGSTWQNNASYYSTIQVGPVAGPGYPDAVIARGPFGIRTWFYCSGAAPSSGVSSAPGCASLAGKSGWTSWLPQDTSSYPQFNPQSNQGQAAAWTELNSLARQANLIGPASTSTVRDVWTGATAPTDDNLTNLNNGVLAFAGCTGLTSANPPHYSSCAVPNGSSGFTGDDWTPVVNETLAEIYDAKQTIDFFAQLTGLNSDTFLAKEAELPAISSSVAALGQAAANNSTRVSPQAIWSTGFGIAGAIAGVLQPEVGALLGIASYVSGIIPSATPDVTAPPFNTTLAGLQNDLANAVTDAAKAVDEQSYEVRQNYGMQRLVAQLTAPSGLWSNVNAAGLKGSMEEGFALWAYKQLLPTVLERDIITGCQPGGANVDCSWTEFNGAIPTTGNPENFTTLNSSHTTNQNMYNASPCWVSWNYECRYTNPPTAQVNGVPGSDIATKVWGPISDTCNFTGDPLTEWTFGCNLGVDPALSTDPVGGPANGWNFTTCTASPFLLDSSDGATAGTCSDATTGSATLGANASVKLTATIGLPRGFHPRTAQVTDKQLLFERQGRGKLVNRRSGSALGTVRLTRGGGRARAARGARKRAGKPAGDTVLGSPSGAPPIKLILQRTSRRHARLTLSVRRVSVKLAHGCQRVRASTSLAVQPFRLETSLKLSDGHVTRRVLLHAQWKCTRDRRGRVNGMRTVAPPSPAKHPGLAVSVTGPRRVTPGSVAMYAVRVHNKRRRSRSRYISSLWHIRVNGRLLPVSGRKKITIRVPRPVVRRVTELRHGKTKLVRIALHIPRDLRRARIHRVCVATLATADSARPAGARTCSKVGRPPPGRG